MSRIAVLSDIHSNLQALVAVWERMDALSVDKVYCLGDIVGYGARPVECVAIIRDHGVVCVQGNHDALVADGSLGLAFNVYSLLAVEHNRALLSAEDLQWLGDLPAAHRLAPNVLFVHGAPDDRDRYLVYLDDMQEASEQVMRDEGPGLCFFGHTHHPLVYDGTRFERVREGTRRLVSGVRSLINPGSVGQPRDSDSRACFAWWDLGEEAVHFERVVYDLEAARQEILDAGLPHILGDRLREGR